MKPFPSSRWTAWLLLCTLVVFAGVHAVAQTIEPGSADLITMFVSDPESSGTEEAAPEFIAPATPEPGMIEQSPGIDKRLFGVIPNYRADQMETVYRPISARQKFAIARSDSFDWPNYFLLVGYTLQSQMASGASKHGDGIQEFGEFYARGLADQVIGNYITEAIMPSLLHEDPRFFRRGTGSVWSRAYYATSRTFIARLDDGGSRLNISELFGNMGVIAISTLYYSESQSASAGAQRYGMTVGNDVISNLMTEFWPDIKHRILSLRHKD